MAKLGKHCGIKFPDTELFKQIDILVGSDKVLATSIKLEAWNGKNNFSEDFISWFENRYNTENAPNFSANTKEAIDNISSAMYEYYYEKHPSIYKTVNREVITEQESVLNYTSSIERENGKIHVADIILDEFNRLNNKNIVLTGNKVKHYLRVVRREWINHIFNAAVADINNDYKTVADVKKDYDTAEDKNDFIDKLFGENKTATAKNLLAVYDELFISDYKSDDLDATALNYITEVLYTPKTIDVLHEIRKDLEDPNILLAKEATDENAPEGTDSTEQMDDLDVSITTLNNHIGVYTTFMTHVGPRIRNYFNSLVKLQSPTSGDFDVNNIYGIADRMDANKCSSMIYNNADTSNISNFKKSIRRIGNTIAGFEAFVQLADDLDKNLDFATEMLTVFQKAIITRFDVVEEDGITSVKIANREASPRNVIVFGMLNDIRGRVEEFSSQAAINKATKLRESIQKLKANKLLTEEQKDAEFYNYQAKLFELIRNYCPSIQDLALQSYVEYNNNTNNSNAKYDNLTKLAFTAEQLIAKCKNVYEAYSKKKLKASEIEEHNNDLDRKKQSGEYIEPSEYLNTDDIWADDFTKAAHSTIQELANILLPYSDVNTSLNSRNIYGNNNSSVINTSWITRIQKMFELNEVQPDGTIRNATLERWGKEMLESPQFNNSSILLEHTDENGGILNYGIFREDVNGNITITPYATDLLKCMLFNGSSFIDNDENASYADMVSGSYGPTSYIAFHKTERLEAHDGFDGNVATYFLGTPSDAPKQFAVTMPKINTLDLITVSDEEKQRVENDITEIIKSEIPVYKFENILKYVNPISDNGDAADQLLEIYNTIAQANKIPDSELYDYLKPTYNLRLSNRALIKKIDDKRAYGTFVTRSGIVITLEGTLVKQGKGLGLSDAHLVGVLNNKVNWNKTAEMAEFTENKGGIPDEVETYYRNKYRRLLSRQDVKIGDKVYKRQEESVNTDSRAFKLLFGKFTQEMIDAGHALNHYFEFVPVKRNGKIVKGEFIVKTNDSDEEFGKPVFKAGANNKQGYKFYHLDENGEVLHSENGEYSVNGKVFGSNKFTLVVNRVIEDENGNKRVVKEPVNYLDRIIDRGSVSKDDGTINLLYGGAMTMTCEVDKEGNPTKVVNVNFSKNQIDNINKNLSEFILDYRDQVIKQINSWEDFIHGVSTDNNAITDYAINYLLAFYSYDELFIGDSKFYKNVQTILKRTKEYQGSGVPCGISDLTLFGTLINTNDIEDIPDDISFLNGGSISQPRTESYVDEKGKLNTRNVVDENGIEQTEEIKIQDLFKGTILEGVKQRTGFKAVTIKNSVKTNNSAIKKLFDKLVNEGKCSKDKAYDILYGKIELDDEGEPKKNKDNTDYKRKGGFTDTKVNDAQSYITVREWVRRVFARGQGQRYLPLIRKLIDPNYKLDSKDIAEFIQVQKNFYFDMWKDTRYGIYASRQIKNAEFVLVPQLIEGTQLEQVYNLMIDAGIDQLNTVETSKAANEKVLTLWDDDGNISAERLENFAKEAKENAMPYSYNCLYTQQETPQHMNAENKAGIQLLKKLTDNLPDDPNTYLGGLKQEFFELLNANIQESSEDVLRDINIPRNADGSIKLDDNGNIKFNSVEEEQKFYKDFYDKLKEELLRTGLDSNTAKFVDIPENATRPDMPCYMNSYITKFESLVQSIFNNGITRQKLPGFHAPQITNVGWKSMNDDIIKLNEDKLKDNSVYKRFAKWAEEHNKTIAFKNGYLTEDSIKVFKEYTDEVYPLQQYAKELRYHEKETEDGKIEYASYIEVLLPYSYLGIDKTSAHYRDMNDKDILKELEEKGLLDLIGYRIPTEGKHSICNMKVVGFIDDKYGSTIVVPDDWVTQTGSDFDVDSVYGIQYETYKKKNGELLKIKYEDDTSFASYYEYLIKDNEEIRNLLYTSLTSTIDLIFDALPSSITKAIKSQNAKISNEIKDLGLQKRDAAIYRADKMYKYYRALIKKNANNTAVDINSVLIIDDFKRLEQLWENLHTYLNSQKEIGKGIVNGDLISLIENNRDKIEKLAKEKGLVSYKEFKDNKFAYKRTSKKARNNRILEIFQEILSDPSVLEETLYRSQFEDLVYDRNEVMNKNVIIARENRSSYNILDQIAFQEEAMSGAKLKAMSVSLDTFCSVCNKVKPELEDGILVVYEKDRFNAKKLSESFDLETTVNTDGIAVRHKSYGWSKNNKNVADKFITEYSSQTTAFILDAIKVGSLPNVNEYTFSVFKLFPNLGCNYRTALAFIMSQGVTDIVNANNANNSVFGKFKGNPIHQAIKDIAKQLGVNVDKNTPVVAILASINAKYKKQFNEIFNVGEEDIDISLNYEDAINIPINVKLLVDRIKEQGEFNSTTPIEKKLLFDLGTILTFNRLKNITDQIGDVARCCNPDKFGAKQTVYATRNVFKTMDDILFEKDYEPSFNDKGELKGFTVIRKPAKSQILSVDKKHILESIYPGCTQVNSGDEYVNYLLSHDDFKESSYPTLYSYLKHTSALSVNLSKYILETENPKFVSLIEGLANVFSGNNKNIDEETYNTFKKYVLSSLYAEVPSIIYNINTRLVDGKIQLSIKDAFDEDGVKIEDDNKIRNIEKARIYGYEHLPVLQQENTEFITDSNGVKKTKKTFKPFVVKDINNPTDKEMEIFEEFSPAQKVKYIQSMFSELGIFGLLDVNLFNGPNRGRFNGMQTIQFKDENLSPNVVYSEFKQAFYNTNPLIVSTAIDLIKYAVQVEGLIMSAKGISKIIDYTPLINEFGEYGLGFVDALKKEMNAIGSNESTYSSQTKVNKLYENFLRSHPDLKQIRTVFLSKKNMDKYGLTSNQYGCYVFEMGNTKPTQKENKEAFDAKLEEVGIKYKHTMNNTYSTNQYIRLRRPNDKKSKLYKIKDLGNTVILYPIDNLEANENADWSCNERNNRSLSRDMYEEIISAYALDRITENITYNYEYVKKQFERLKQEKPDINTYYEKRKKVREVIPASDFDINDCQPNDTRWFAKEEIEKQFSERIEGKHYLMSSAFDNYIYAAGKDSGSVQRITTENGRQIDVLIYKSTLNGMKIDKDHIDNIVRIKDKQAQDLIIEKMVKNGSVIVHNLYTVIQLSKPIDPNDNTEEEANYSQGEESLDSLDEESIMSGTTIDVLSRLHSNVIRFMKNRKQDEGDSEAAKILYKLGSKGVSARVASIKSADPTFTTREIASYADNLSKVIYNMFNNFMPDPDNDGSYLKMLDPVVIKTIKTNRDYRKKFQLACNLAQAYIDLFSSYSELKASSDDLGIEHQINSILANVKKIKDIPLNEANRIYYNIVAASWSTNPNIKEGIIEVLDGYWRTYGPMWKFNDIMETGSPLMQIVLRDIMSDLEAKRKAGKMAKQDFVDAVNKIYKAAASRGETINMSHIIKDGDYVEDYIPKLRENYDKLVELRNEAILKHGFGSIEHLKAKLELDEFITKHFNQEAKQQFYIEKHKATRKILNTLPHILSRWEKLQYERREIYNRRDVNGFSEQDAKRLDEIQKELNNLRHPNTYIDADGNLRKRPSIVDGGAYVSERDVAKYNLDESEIGFHPADDDTLRYYSVEAQEAINEYAETISTINSLMYKDEAAFGFDEKLEEVLATIRSYEDRDANGITKHPIDELMKIDRYREAVEWLNENAYFKWAEGVDAENPNNYYTRLQAAFKRLAKGNNNKDKRVNDICRQANDGKGIYVDGVPDARLLSKEEIEKIKDAQQDAINLRQNPAYSGNSLISNAPQSDEIYTEAFYQKMKANATDTKASIAYNETVKKINKILEKYRNPISKIVNLELIPDNEEGLKDLQDLANHYLALRAIRPTIHSDATNKPEIRKFMQEEVVPDTNTTLFLGQFKEMMNGKSDKYKELAKEVLCDKYLEFEDGVPVGERFATEEVDGELIYKPNAFLYTRLAPRNKERYLDVQRSEDINLLKNTYEKTETIYYRLAKDQAYKNGTYNEWYYANHIFNPATGQMEPLDCWLTYKVKDEVVARGDLVGRYFPKGKERSREIRDGKIKVNINGVKKEINDPKGNAKNPNYREEVGLFKNYIKGADPQYDSNITLNQSEQELKELFKKTVMNYANNATARRFFESNLPRMGRNTDTALKTVGKEALKMVGVTGANKKARTDWKTSIGFIEDELPDIPMKNLLKTKQSYDYEKEIDKLRKDRKVIEDTNYDDADKKIKELKAIDDKIAEYDKKIKEIHVAHLNNDWTYVIGEFIEQMSRFNAVQDNKQALYHLLNMLHNYKTFNTSKNIIGNLKRDRATTSKDEPIYEESVDTKLIEQYENFIRRLVFDQWKEDSGMTVLANALQGFTSANYMMMNIKGGVANVALGESNILAEAAAKEFFEGKDWGFGTGQWNLGVTGFCRRAYHNMIGSDVGYFNKQEAIVDFFAVVDYDERSGVVTETNLEKYSKALRDAMFSPQNIGEHYMQNSVLFAMLHCHKIVALDNGEVVYMNKNDYIRYREAENIKSILTPEQQEKFEKFKKEIKASPNDLRDFAWFRKDLFSQFITRSKLSKEQIDKIVKSRKENEKKYIEEFDKLENMYDQIEVKDGKFHFKDGSDLAKLYDMPSYDGSKINKAYELLGKFTERVRKVNNKIHGVYNKDGRAYIESKWWGSLVMQYHKHIPMGILKHYMRRGHWNEFRGSVDKGMLQSVIDFHRLNLERVKVEAGLTDEQLGALEGFKFLITSCMSYLGNLRLTWNIMPEYDRANIRRRFGDYAIVLAALSLTAAMWAIAGGGADDDTPDSLAFNFWIYQFDRWASEGFLFHPIGALSESRKLLSSPVAAKSIIDDGFKTCGLLLNYLFDDEYDPYYHSGRFAGEHKLSVYIKRRIPIYSAIYNTLGLTSANHYYKYGENPIGIFNVKKMVLD